MRFEPRPPNFYKSLHSFTLIELLSTISIVAVLVLGAMFFTTSYVAWTQQITDQHNLEILNDALNRYKTEGGNMSALTSGAPIGHILTQLATTINWNGFHHNVMRQGTTFAARSLYSKGNGTDFRFTAYNTYTSETGGVSTPTPTPIINIPDNGNTLNFAAVTVGNSTTRAFVINNTGTAPLVVSGISYPSAVYTADWSSGTIAPSGSQTVNVTFTPPDTNTYSGTVTVSSNASSGGNTIHITGTGITGGFQG